MENWEVGPKLEPTQRRTEGPRRETPEALPRREALTGRRGHARRGGEAPWSGRARGRRTGVGVEGCGAEADPRTGIRIGPPHPLRRPESIGPPWQNI